MLGCLITYLSKLLQLLKNNSNRKNYIESFIDINSNEEQIMLDKFSYNFNRGNWANNRWNFWCASSYPLLFRVKNSEHINRCVVYLGIVHSYDNVYYSKMKITFIKGYESLNIYMFKDIALKYGVIEKT
ncbi:hypothetical protein MCAL160_0458 [Mycoplasmopsis californica HAZ160_1]|uniref:Uncharacterized protein n=2 Tax=Mycoplasmopsis californica TaxID=2113 RepID=A0A059XR44_9BACT|nr:hypothetical protein [Mycoplasmopsis californica]AIA29525.1 hypothetical protein MCFN_01920 [Mycoplasmopsis californica]BAP01032.1 hypothetical protein MCAL160_0458 [Mycoplasmopsis californica HAZ160_1]BBG40897.1 hypothetical protein MCAL106_0458 [Mycoplasmopsis californica]BBG41491.1 hypothetical protein MCAL106E_0458 [Mycoplasmopsis californica]BBG42084.1 hypothetical protein MCAL106L_0458 [Mycoplasmopsis californica]